MYTWVNHSFFYTFRKIYNSLMQIPYQEKIVSTRIATTRFIMRSRNPTIYFCTQDRPIL